MKNRKLLLRYVILVFLYFILAVFSTVLIGKIYKNYFGYQLPKCEDQESIEFLNKIVEGLLIEAKYKMKKNFDFNGEFKLDSIVGYREIGYDKLRKKRVCVADLSYRFKLLGEESIMISKLNYGIYFSSEQNKRTGNFSIEASIQESN